jgi:hypothetical protein
MQVRGLQLKRIKRKRHENKNKNRNKFQSEVGAYRGNGNERHVMRSRNEVYLTNTGNGKKGEGRVFCNNVPATACFVSTSCRPRGLPYAMVSLRTPPRYMYVRTGRPLQICR